MIPSIVTVVGVMEQVVAAGQPLTVMLMGWLNFARGASVTVELPDDPLLMVSDVGEADMVKSGPDPERDTDCGLPVALSANDSVAVCFP